MNRMTHILIWCLFAAITTNSFANNAPTFSSSPVIEVEINQSYNYTISANDADGDGLILTTPTLPPWLSLNSTAIVSTFAGSGVAGSVNDTGTVAQFNYPEGAAVDNAGNIYVADNFNHTIRKITPAGVVTTLAGVAGVSGNDDGVGTAAKFSFPQDVAVDSAGNVYVADVLNHTIRKITPGGSVTTIAGSGSAGFEDDTAAMAEFDEPQGLALDGENILYVADYKNNRIRKINLVDTVVTTIAGSGIGGFLDSLSKTAEFNGPTGVAIDGLGHLYVADFKNHKIRKINLMDTAVTTLAGSTSGDVDAMGASAQFAYPRRLAISARGDVYVADRSNHKIRKITPAGLVTTFAGSGSFGYADGFGVAAGFNEPRGITIDAAGMIYVVDYGNHSVRKISEDSFLTGIAPDMSGVYPVVLQIDDGSVTVDQSFNIKVLDKPTVSINAATSIITNEATLNATLISDGEDAITEFGFVYSLTDVDANPSFAEVDGINVFKLAQPSTSPPFSQELTNLLGHTDYSYIAYATNSKGTSESDLATFTTLNTPPTFTFLPQDTVRANSLYSFTISTSDGDGDDLSLTSPTLPSWLNLDGTMVSTLAGSGSLGNTDTTANLASFNSPHEVTLDVAGNIYVADFGNHKIRKITPNGIVSTLAGSTVPGDFDATGTSAQFKSPYGVATDIAGNVYVADGGNHKIRKITPLGIVTTLAGTGIAGDVDDVASAAQFNNPYDVALDTEGNLYVADGNNHKIRKITPLGVVTTLAGTGIAGDVDDIDILSQFNTPYGLDVDAFGNVYVADFFNHKIRKVTPSGVVTTLAGTGIVGSADGPANSAQFSLPAGLTVDAFGNTYVADFGNSKIRKITPSGVVSTMAGTGITGDLNGDATVAEFRFPAGLALDNLGNVYVADGGNHKIRKIEAAKVSGTVPSQVGNYNISLNINDGYTDVSQSFTITVIDLPTVIADTTTNITSTQATLHANVSNDGGRTITERGFVYALTSDDVSPSLAEANGTTVIKIIESGTMGVYSHALSELKGNQNYSYIAYATNSVGSAESNVETFNTEKYPLTITGLGGVDKIYDGNKNASANGSPILVGVQPGDTVILEDSTFFYFVTSGVGTDLNITSSGFSLSGSDVGNYILTPPTLSASITAKPLNVIGLIGLDKVYDGTTTAEVIGTGILSGLESGDTVILEDSTYYFATSEVGTDLEITSSGFSLSGSDAGNYILTPPTLSASITAKPLNIIGLIGLDKVYDGTTTAEVIGTGILSGLESGDTVILEDSTYYFTTSGVGTDLNITSSGYSLSGSDAGNYILTPPTLSASITAKPLNVIGLIGLDKVYDGTTTAEVIGTGILSGLESGDTVILEDSTYYFATSEVGTDLNITSSGYSLSGSDAGNYILTPPTLSASITAKPLNITGLIGLDKVYDGTTTAEVIGTGILSGLESGDTVILEDSTYYFATSEVGTDLEITSSGFSLSGSDAGNYILMPPTLTASITAIPLTISGLSPAPKVFDSTTTANVTGTPLLEGVKAGDDVTLAGTPIFTLASAEVGTGIAITTTSYVLNGSDAGNYSLLQPTLYQDITVNLEFSPSVNPIPFQFNPYSGLVEFDLRAIENPSIRVMNSAGQIIHSQADISSADYTLELLGASGLYFIEITDKVGQARGFSVMKK